MNDKRVNDWEEESSWLMDIKEPNNLRKAVYEMKHFYITTLIDAGILQPSESHYTSFTVSQLQYMAEKVSRRSGL
ncbi:hypothetical protein [Halobacillus sp. Marseille-Q1614]|uniref:hypothetical protein n=1 Tax=Halobacillus sp. Marseille-Q1614 TaxID=2709134 RepID=UPI00156EB6C8|nr:hypothetical protein [Halobacillus sp. Marseille-Q1614]